MVGDIKRRSLVVINEVVVLTQEKDLAFVRAKKSGRNINNVVVVSTGCSYQSYGGVLLCISLLDVTNL